MSSIYRASASPKPTKSKPLPQHKVRTSTKDRTLDSMFSLPSASQRIQPSSSSSSPRQTGSTTEEKLSDPQGSFPRSQSPVKSKGRARVNDKIKESECFLTSVNELRKEVVEGKHASGLAILLKFACCSCLSNWGRSGRDPRKTYLCRYC